MNLRTLILMAVAVIIAVQTDSLGQRIFSRGYSRPDGTAEIIAKIRQYPTDSGLLVSLRNGLADEKNPKLQQQGLAIIALAMMRRGDLEVGLRARRVLLERYPESEYRRALAFQNLGGDCPNCDGEGQIGRMCPVCEGSGRCQMCAGSGTYAMKLDEGRQTVCPKCGGAGTCVACNGGGRAYRVCHKCEGHGFLFDKQRIDASYRAVLSGQADSIGDPPAAQPGVDAREKITPERRERDGEDALQYF